MNPTEIALLAALRKASAVCAVSASAASTARAFSSIASPAGVRVTPRGWAREELDIEVGFELSDCLGERGLGEVELSRRARDRSLLCDGDEVSQLPLGQLLAPLAPAIALR
jgi:hypothetical protein